MTLSNILVADVTHRIGILLGVSITVYFTLVLCPHQQGAREIVFLT